MLQVFIEQLEIIMAQRRRAQRATVPRAHPASLQYVWWVRTRYRMHHKAISKCIFITNCKYISLYIYRCMFTIYYRKLLNVV